MSAPLKSGPDSLAQLGHQVVFVHAPLTEAVAIANPYRAVAERLAIDGDAIGRAGFVLPAIAAADRALLVVEDGHLRLDGAIDPLGDFGHAILLYQRKDGRL